jgi:AcrR family transcriptional regulator
MARLAERHREALHSMMQEGIYDAAVLVLTRHGLAGLTMDRVADEAGLAKGSLYKYFRNKSSMIRFVHQRTIEPARCRFQEILSSEGAAADKLEAGIQMWFEYLDQNRGLFNFLFNDYSVRELLKDQEQTTREWAIQDLAEIIEQGIRSGAFRPVHADLVARLMLGAVRQVVERQLAMEGTWPIAEMTRDLMDFFVHGLKSCEPCPNSGEQNTRPPVGH